MPWYALACASQFETRVAALLGSVAYIPVRTVWRKVRKRAGPRRERKEFPLIPGYVLIERDGMAAAYALMEINSNAFGFVAAGGKPLSIRDSEIERLKLRERCGDFDATIDMFKRLLGQYQVHEGTLRNRLVTVSSVRNRDLVLDVDGFNRPVIMPIAQFGNLSHTRIR